MDGVPPASARTSDWLSFFRVSQFAELQCSSARVEASSVASEIDVRGFRPPPTAAAAAGGNTDVGLEPTAWSVPLTPKG